MKKIFIGSLILLIIILFFLGIYNFAFKKEINGSNASKIPTQVSEQKKYKAVEVLNEPTLGVSYDKKTRAIFYYFASDGTAWKSDEDGKNVQRISSTKINGLKNVLWSPDHSKVLTSVEKDGSMSFYEYDYNSQKATNLKNGLDSAYWDNTGVKIFYKYFDSKSGSRTLNISNPDGSEWQKLADVQSRNLFISQIPLTSFVTYWNAPDANEETKFMMINSVGGEPRTLLAGRYGADYLWSPDGSQALISSLASKGVAKISLGTISIDGNYNDLKISTLVSKCVWSSDSKNIYCAVPDDIPSSVVMPNDYQTNKFSSKDSFWKINVSNGKAEKIDIDQPSYDATNLFMSLGENILYFTNRLDQKLYKIDLQK